MDRACFLLTESCCLVVFLTLRLRLAHSFSYGLRIERSDIGSYADHNESEPDPGRTRGERSLSAGPIVILCICVDGPLQRPLLWPNQIDKLCLTGVLQHCSIAVWLLQFQSVNVAPSQSRRRFGSDWESTDWRIPCCLLKSATVNSIWSRQRQSQSVTSPSRRCEAGLRKTRLR